MLLHFTLFGIRRLRTLGFTFDIELRILCPKLLLALSWGVGRRRGRGRIGCTWSRYSHYLASHCCVGRLYTCSSSNCHCQRPTTDRIWQKINIRKTSRQPQQPTSTPGDILHPGVRRQKICRLVWRLQRIESDDDNSRNHGIWRWWWCDDDDLCMTQSVTHRHQWAQ